MTCEKTSYSKGGALRVLRRMQRNVRRGPLPIRIYYCQTHKGWHITSKPKRSSNGG